MTPPEDHTADRSTGLAEAVASRALATAGRLALVGVSSGLHALENSRTLRRAVERYGDTALQIAAATPLGRLLPDRTPHDDAHDEAKRIVHAVRTESTPDAQTATTRTPSQPATRQQSSSRPPSASQPATTPQAGTASRPPKAPRPTARAKPQPARRVSKAAQRAGAPGAAAATASAAVQKLVATEDLPTTPSRDELPITDFDSATLASLRARLRSLSLPDLAMLREYEQAHAHRLPVMTMLDNRIAKLSATDPATSSSA